MEIVRTKIVPPANARGFVPRPRLAELARDVGQSRLTVVQAPAGYGKTTLLRDWREGLAASGADVGWLTVDVGERTPAALFVYLAAMLSACDPTLGPDLTDLAGSAHFLAQDFIVAAVSERLLKAERPLVLFLDDVHLLGGRAAATLERIIALAPAHAHFVLASREIPDWPLGRMRASGQLLELGARELRFTEDEALAFMTNAGHAGLAPQDVSVLVERTEGWVAGLALASIALRKDKDAAAAIRAFSGRRRAVADFFADDVFGSQGVAVQEFLLETCVLGRLCPELCDTLTGRSNGRQMLDHLEAAGLFLAPLDDERRWYRYHSLFSDFLLRRLTDIDPTGPRNLHRRASQWFAQAGLLAEALEHAAAAGDHEWLASLLEENCEDLTYTGKLTLVAKYAEQLPAKVIARFPKTLLALAWRRTRSLRLRESRDLIDLAAKRIDELAEAADPAPDAISDLRLLRLHGEMMLKAAEDDMPLVEEQCQVLIRDFKDANPYITCTLYAQLITARREQFKFSELEQLEATAAAIPGRSGYKFANIALQAVIGASLIAEGKTHAARGALEQGLTEAVHFGGLNSGLAALPALPLSELMYEWNDLERAEELIDGHLPVAREFGFVDQLISGYLIRPRLMQARGDLAAAFAALDSAMAVALECRLERLELNIFAERVRLLIRTGHPDRAADLARAEGIADAGTDLAPRAASTTADEIRAQAWVRLALSQGRAAEALALAKQWRSFCGHRGAVRSLIRWNLLVVQILSVGGDVHAAQRALRDAIGAAAPGRFIRSFVDEGPVIRNHLTDAYAETQAQAHPHDAFAAEVLRAFAPASQVKLTVVASEDSADQGLYGKLGARELEILSLVGSGLRNREIGARLGLTEGTVKWYMQQIYDKTGTRRRPQAVDRARQFGLLA
jgi:LuxR family maltose regulon positive regulatory protein